MRIYAHRGVSAHYPENTLAAFARAIELGVDGIELDVRSSADGVPVVIHDDTVERTTNAIGSIADFTAKQLNLLDAGHRQHVPTLAAVLKLAEGKARVNIELKESAVVPAVLEVTSSFGNLDWFASGSDWDALKQLRALAPGSDVHPLTVGNPLGMDSPGDLADAIEFVINHGGSGVSIWEGSLDQASVDLIHGGGLKVWAWTVNDGDRACELAQLGVDAVCTDDPELVRNAVGLGIS